MTVEIEAEEIERLGWNEALHPRQGGKFAPKGTATGKAAPAAAGHGHSARGGGSEGLSYNGRTGAGYGKKGGDNRVSALQSELNRLGFADGSGKALKKDGKLGPRTTAAIKRAQKALGLKPDGVATPRLLAKLKAAQKTTTHKTAAKKAAPRLPNKGKATPARKAAVPAKKAAAAPKRPTFGKQANPPAATKKAAPVRKNVSA